MVSEFTDHSDLSDPLDDTVEVAEGDQAGKFKRFWYAVQVASGCEKKVKSTIEQRVHTLDVADRIFRIEIPQTPVIKIKKDGSRQTIEEKIFPGYVLVQVRAQQSPETGEWQIDDEAWQVIKNTPNVINFVGAEQRRSTGRGRGHVKPMPLSPAEVDRIFRKTQEQEPVHRIDLNTGDKIKVLNGPFKDFEGEVIEVSAERSKLKALLSIFGRETPVELEVTQVEKVD
ncbi:MAG: transcription termination/antitermination protein NusG [Thermosynechococcus sp. Uc]|uniref:transcription termination/antitermination protein NusG n=1 Tax=Thermosynechococcus sp. Uc TaxID=3034853 RepID=UPI0019F475A7|nr:transcription termination/antitermination protein NusG [Thermosynechococcus sp. Uc]MDM7326274.1 transcription termination/antitermination protein NusG [Thermosynechococcus sp. Uc]HIK26313.1 transcription termination/antitermination protein NusG [Thermosynechococcus sp. M46_R2017_013]